MAKALLTRMMTMNDIDTYRLDQLPSVYGREISYIKGTEHVEVKCNMYACEDLILTHTIDIEFIFPLNFVSKGGMRIMTSHPDVFQHTEYHRPGSNQLIIGMFDNAKYPLGVWFFTLRYSLLKEKDPWVTPFELCRSLPVPCRRIDGGNIQSVSMISGAGRTRGRRSYMEDVDFAFDNIRISERYAVASYGVLDGHGGAECAKFAVDDIPMKLATYLRSGMSCNEAIYSSFLNTDSEFLKSGRSTAGSTACVLVWDPVAGTAFIANTGDTRAVMSRSGRAVELTQDKKATNHEEIARVCLGGGFVVNGRVLGSLAVSRALGDAQLKQPGKRTVIADPDVTTFRPNATPVNLPSGQEALDIDEFIIIATDGLWDVMSSQQAVDFVREALTKCDSLEPDRAGAATTAVLDQIGDQLANHAVKNLSSLDNVTVMIIRISIGALNVVVPDTIQLEGWQWSRPKVTNSRSQSFDVSTSATGSSSSYSGPSASGKAVAGAKAAVDEFDDLLSSRKPEPKSLSSKSTQQLSAPMGNAKAKDSEDDRDMLEFLLDDSNF